MERSVHLEAVRFSGDLELWEALSREEELSGPLSIASYDKHRTSIRAHLLATAVRVDPRMLPKLDASIRAMRERAHYASRFEAYVFEDPAINAFITEGTSHTYLGLSSGAVNTLSSEEIEFVIGHELGHALFRHISARSIASHEEQLENRLRKRLLAWRRASEISADRCGLVCCGSIDVAASAIFRSISGLATPGLKIHPEDFSEQWDHLLAEVIKGGDDDAWQHSHPFPPMRMKAIVLFWQSTAPALPAGRPGAGLSLQQVDEEVIRLLTTMDPVAREKHDSADPLLEDFLLWGGLYMTYAGGVRDEAAAARLKGLVASGAMARGLAQTTDPAQFAQHIRDAIGRRHKKLRALEINRILKSMLHVGCANRRLTSAGKGAFKEVASILGIEAEACDVVCQKYYDDMGDGDGI